MSDVKITDDQLSLLRTTAFSGSDASPFCVALRDLLAEYDAKPDVQATGKQLDELARVVEDEDHDKVRNDAVAALVEVVIAAREGKNRMGRRATRRA